MPLFVAITFHTLHRVRALLKGAPPLTEKLAARRVFLYLVSTFIRTSYLHRLLLRALVVQLLLL